MSSTHHPDEPTDLFVDESGPEQQQVRSLLAGLPEPGPMPADLVARIQARLADEALAQAHESPEVVRLDSRRRRRTLGVVAGLGGAAAAAAVVGVVMTGGLGSLDRGSGSAVAGIGPSSSTSTAAAPTGPSIAITVSDTAVTEATLDTTASRLVQATAATPQPGAAESPMLGPLATPQGLTDCLARLQAPAYRKVAAQLSPYEGRPAVVLGLTGTDGTISSWVLDRTCTPVTPLRAIS